MARSYFAKIIPHEKAGEYFGIYDIFGKGASFMGTFLVALVADISGRENYGVGALAVMFLIGLALFLVAVRFGKKSAAAGSVPAAEPVREGVASGAPALPEEGSQPLSQERPQENGQDGSREK